MTCQSHERDGTCAWKQHHHLHLPANCHRLHQRANRHRNSTGHVRKNTGNRTRARETPLQAYIFIAWPPRSHPTSHTHSSEPSSNIHTIGEPQSTITEPQLKFPLYSCEVWYLLVCEVILPHLLSTIIFTKKMMT